MDSIPLQNYKFIIGIDEAGRGCSWGPVFAGAVILPPSLFNEETMTDTEKFLLRDSKKLSKKRRDESADFIRKYSICNAVETASQQEIDDYNILQATMLAMHRAIDNCCRQLISIGEDLSSPNLILILVDGNRFVDYSFNDFSFPHECIVGGDDKYRQISAASILAKTSRDNFVSNAIIEEPELESKWQFSKHNGYCTTLHNKLLLQHGIHKLHRRSYRPVKLALGINTDDTQPKSKSKSKPNSKQKKINQILQKQDLSKVDECLI